MNKNINRKLIVAYSNLLEKESEKINVTALCEKANVARASFYVYYSDLEEFQKKVNDYIIDKFFRQSVVILTCSDDELSTVVKKENLLFDNCELGILSHMIKGTNYIDFVLLAESYYSDLSISSVYTDEILKNYKDDIDFFSRGYLPILVDGLTCYRENRFRKDMKQCRIFFRALCDYIQSRPAEN